MNGTHAFATTAVVVQRRENATEPAGDAESATGGDDAHPSAGIDDARSRTGFEASFEGGDR